MNALLTDLLRYVYMLGAKYGLAQSMYCAAQTMDPYFARQSMDRTYLRAQGTNSWTIHGLRCVRKQLICSQVQSKDKLQVSGIVLTTCS